LRAPYGGGSPGETKDEKETEMKRALIAIAAAAVLASSNAWALQFPESCVSPPATVTRITGVNTRNARMEARYTMPDIIQACNEGYVDQANAPPALCIKRHRTLINAAPLHAHADCVAGMISVEGESTFLPIYPGCAGAPGGFRAIAAFKTLCPSYGGQVESKEIK
jgi:hypothetical protein